MRTAIASATALERPVDIALNPRHDAPDGGSDLPDKPLLRLIV